MKTGHLNIGDFYLGLTRNGTRMARLRRTTFVLFVGGILAYGAAFAGHMLDRFDLVNLIRDFNFDDAFYYYQVASRMAAGEFSTSCACTRSICTTFPARGGGSVTTTSTSGSTIIVDH